MVQILENLTSNAIEQAITLPPEKRKITLNLHYEDGVNTISITNPTDNSSLSLNEMITSGKTTKDNKHHGLGLSSINLIVSKNNMSFYGKISNDLLTFTLSYKDESK